MYCHVYLSKLFTSMILICHIVFLVNTLQKSTPDFSCHGRYSSHKIFVEHYLGPLISFIRVLSIHHNLLVLFFFIHVQVDGKPQTTVYILDAPPTKSTPGIFRISNCFFPFLILYSIVLKSDRLTIKASLRNLSRA